MIGIVPSCRSVALLLLIALTACGGDDRPAGTVAEAPPGGYKTLGGGPPGGTLVVLADREPDALNPLTFESLPASQVTHLLFRTLARRDTVLGEYVPDLARSWELSPDSGSVILRLRDDIRWHDSVPVTAEDVVWSIRQQKSDQVASTRQNEIAGIGEVEVVDSFTVRAELLRPGPYTVNSLLEVMPAPKHLLDTVPPERLRFSPFGRAPVGNGWFRFGGWTQGQQITLLANEDAPEGRPALDQIVMRFVPDMNAALTELLAGQGDLLPKLPPEQRERVEAAPNVDVYSGARVRPAWIAWNTDRAPVNDPRVRRAVLMGIDRDALTQALFGEVGEPALTPFPKRLREHSPGVRPIPFDPQRAAQLLEQAGWRDTDGDGIREKGGQPLRLTVDYISTDQTRQDVLVATQAMLRRIGVDLQLQPFESTAWVERLRNREFQGSLWGWGYGPGVVGPNAEVVFHSRSIPPDGPNFAGYSNPRVDALIDSALVTYDTAQARGVWRQIEQRITNDAVYAPLYLDPELYGVNSRFANVRLRGTEWWEDVPFWYIPADRRLPRDRAR